MVVSIVSSYFFDSIVESPTISLIFYTIFRPLIKTAAVLYAAARYSYARTIHISVLAFSSISPTILAIKTIVMSSAIPTVVHPIGSNKRSTLLYNKFHSRGSSTDPLLLSSIVCLVYCYPCAQRNNGR